MIDLDIACRIGENFGTKPPSTAHCPPEMAKIVLDATNLSTGALNKEMLSKYVASVAYDLWSLGVLLFHLCFGRRVWNHDQNDNVMLDDLHKLANWSHADLNRLLTQSIPSLVTSIAFGGALNEESQSSGPILATRITTPAACEPTS